MTVQRFELNLAGRPLTIETGKLAGQANGAVTVRYGDTVILATATASKEPREGIDFFPLTVDFEERLYAIGKIPGSFGRREGRPPESAILAGRLTDRPIRPLFPKGYRNDVQVIITTLSADQVNNPDVLGIIGASAALTISDIPFEGPIAAVRLGYLDGEIVINPPMPDLARSEMDMVIAGSADAIMMVEGSARQLPEAIVLEALLLGHQTLQPIIELALGLYFTGTVFYALANQIYGTLPFLMLFQIGFLYTGLLSILQQVTGETIISAPEIAK